MSHPVHPDLLPAGVRAIELAPGVPGLAFTHPAFNASLSLYGGQLLGFTPHGGQPLFYLSPAAMLQPGKAIRGGVPLCWPWFGKHDSDASLPQHGVARTAQWTVNAVARSEHGFHVKLNGPRYGELSSSLSLVLEDKGVSLALTTRNHGKYTASVSAALHSYIAVGDLRQVALSGLENAGCHDKLTDTHGTLPATPWRFVAATDAVVGSGAPLQLHDEAWQRTVTISSSGSASTVVWTPWQNGAAAMADLPDDGWPHFLCVEAANAGSDRREIAPGDSHTLAQHLRLLRV